MVKGASPGQQPHEQGKPLPRVGRDAIIYTMGYLALPRSGYFVVGGANLVLRGIRTDTTDLDMLVSDKIFAQLTEHEGAELREPPKSAIDRGATNPSVKVSNGCTRIPVSAVTAVGHGFYPMTFESHREHTEVVEGISCLALEQVIASKAALGRPKDIEDLAAIAQFLGEAIILPPPIPNEAWADYDPGT